MNMPWMSTREGDGSVPWLIVEPVEVDARGRAVPLPAVIGRYGLYAAAAGMLPDRHARTGELGR